MPLQRGPFKLQPDDAVTVTPGEYTFEADAIELAHKLQAIDLGWNELFATIDALASDPLEDLASLDLDLILYSAEVGSGAAELGSLDFVTAVYPFADDQLDQALAFAPTSAYADPPTPFIPPFGVLDIYTPHIDPSAFDPHTAGSIGTPPTSGRPDAELENLTRFGATNFVVGDMFKLLVLGFEGQVVTVASTKNGQLLGTGTLGTIGHSGDFVLSGVMGPDFIGVWVYAVYLDGRLIKSFGFYVTP
jgi:hypothetical protein